MLSNFAHHEKNTTISKMSPPHVNVLKSNNAQDTHRNGV